MRHLDPFGWPLAREVSDPWDGASTLPDPDASWADHLAWARPPLPDKATWTTEDRLWQHQTWEVLRGERSWEDPEWQARSQRLGLVGPRTHDKRPLPRASFPLDLALLADLLENQAPDLPEAALDFVLGPYADLDPSPQLRRLSAAVTLFLRVHDHGRRTVDAWVRDSGRPHLEMRRALKALDYAPSMLWDTTVNPWVPLLPMMDGARPTSPVEGTVLPLVPRPMVCAVARVMPLADGRWMAHTALGLPEVPPKDLLLRRLTLTLWRVRRAHRRATWEDALRARPEVLYRTCAIWCGETLEDC